MGLTFCKGKGSKGEPVTTKRMEVRMLDRLTEIFCDMDDFCNAFFPSVGSVAAE
jgi:hypothetical protein